MRIMISASWCGRSVLVVAAAITTWLLLHLQATIVAGSDELGAARHRSDGGKGAGEWKIILYTGNKLWAGTDSDLYVELIGTNGNSNIIRLQPRPSQLEADDVDVFSLGTLEGRELGTLKSIVVAKQHSYAFFNDWELVKAEVLDPNGRRYIFKCSCWFTTLKYKRLIELSEIEGERPSSIDSDELSASNTRSTRVFPLTITFLLLLLVLITFTYFGNEICKKWRENFLIFSMNSRNVQSLSHRSEGGYGRNSGRHATTAPTDAEQVVNILLNPNNQLTSIIDDKPPDYKALFPVAPNSAAFIVESTAASDSVTTTTSNAAQTTNLRRSNSVASTSPPPPPLPPLSPSSNEFVVANHTTRLNNAVNPSETTRSASQTKLTEV